MSKSQMEDTPEDDDIDETIPHPLPDELGLFCLDDPDLIQKLDERWAVDGPTIPWSEILRESNELLRNKNDRGDAGTK